MSLSIDLSNKHALVCGSSKGIGRAIAITLAKQGASVTLMARSAALLDEVKDELQCHANQTHHIIAADFGERANVIAKLKSHSARHPIQIVVNNTGGPSAGPLTNATSEELVDAFGKHIVLSQEIAKLVIPQMKEVSYGRFVNIISTSVKEPIPNLGVSNTIRGAMGNWAKTMAGELGPFGITVNNILPGFTETGRLSAIIKNKAAKAQVSEEEMSAQMRASVPLGRFATPFEIASVAAFLVSPAAAYINGINLPVDGGRTKSL